MSLPSNDKHYDEQLLAHAPEVTKADLQGGYNPDILIAPRPPSSRVRSPDPEVDPRDIESSGSTSPPKEIYHPAQPRSFWKTRKGIIVITSIVILIAVILGAVLGGVLGTRNHGNSKSAPSAPNSGNSQGGVGGGQNGVSSSVASTTSVPPASGSPTDSGNSSSSESQFGGGPNVR